MVWFCPPIFEVNERILTLLFLFPTGASTANLSLRSIYVVVNTNLAACGGGIGWALLDYFHTRQFSILGFCSGIIGGLVGITPAAGFGMLYFPFFL